MSFHNALRRLFPSWYYTRSAPRHKSRRPRPLFLENLEERSVPAILFSSTGSRSIIDSGGPILQSMQVDLIFWGAGWNGAGLLRTNVQNTVNAFLNSPYFDGLAQYRGIGHGSVLRSDTFTTSNPPASFTTAFGGDISTFVGTNINNGTLPAPNGRILYFVIPQPGSTASDCGCVGRHLAGIASGNRVFPYGVTNNPANVAIETLSKIMSHEMVEAASNPEWNITVGGTSQAAFHVPGSNGDEIGDGEAQNYTYRVHDANFQQNTALVQSFLSQRDHAYIVTNGSTNNFLVSSTRVLTLTTPFVGNQFFIGLVGNGVAAELNSSTAQFEPGAISSVQVTAPSGLLQIAGTPVPVNVQYNGANAQVDLGNSTDGVQDIHGVVNLQNSNGRTTVDVDDSGNHGGTTARQMLPGAGFDIIHGLAPADIMYRGVQTGAVYIFLGSGANTFTVENTNTAPANPPDATTLTTGLGNALNTVFVQGTTSPLNVMGRGPNTTVNIGNPTNGVQSIRGAVKLQNSGGRTTLNVDDTGDVFGRAASQILPGDGFDYIHQLAQLVDISYRGVQTGAVTITLGGSFPAGGNTFTVENTNTAAAGSDATTLITGPGDTINAIHVHGTTSPLNVVSRGPNTTVDVGNGGSLGGIFGAVNVVGFANHTDLTVNDSADAFADRLITLSATALTVAQPGLVTINYSAINALTYEGGPGRSGANTYLVSGTPALTGVTLHARGSNDTLVGPTAATGFNITGSNAGQLTSSALGGPVTFTGIRNLTGASGNDAFLFGDGAGVTGNISDIGGAADTLDYSAYSTPVTVDLSAGTATGVGGSVSNILTLRGGTGNDSLTGNAAGTTDFVASPGNDTITGLGVGNFLFNADANGTADSTWNVTAQNSGTLTFAGATTTFSGVQSLVGGGTGADTFVFADGAGVDGLIQGSVGINTLDYTAYSTGVDVNLQTGTTTGVAAGIMLIQNVTGGQGANILVGDGNENLTGGTGQSLLISGGGTRRLTGGGAGDILIGGTTMYDMDDASLQAILNYWTTSGDDYPTRVVNLRAGNGVPQLEAGITVFDNGAANTLTGNGNEALGLFNLFYVTEAGTVTDPQPDEVVVDIDNPAGAPQRANHGDPGNLSRESRPPAADLYFLRHRDEVTGMHIVAEPARGGQTAAAVRAHPAVRPAGASLESTASDLDLLAELQPTT